MKCHLSTLRTMIARNTFRATFFIPGMLLSCATFAQALPVKQAELIQLSKLKNEIEHLSTDGMTARRAFEAKKIEISALKKESASADREVAAAKEKRQKLEDADSQDPGSINPERLAQARRENDAAYDKKRKASAQLSKASSALTELERDYLQKLANEKTLRSEYESRLAALAEGIVTARKGEFQKPQQVEATGNISCGDMQVKECKEKSLKEAERQAVERGSVIVVDSVSEISNSKLTKDQIRSATRGRISGREILSAKFVNDDTAFQTTIRAQITPGLGPELLAEMRQSARMDIEAQIGGGLPPALSSALALDDPAPRRDDTPNRDTSNDSHPLARTDAATPNKAVTAIPSF